MLNLTPGVMTRVGGWRGKGKGDTEGPGSRIQSTYSLLGGLHSARELLGAGLRVNLKTENLHTPSYRSDNVSQGSCFVCVGGRSQEETVLNALRGWGANIERASP